MLKQRHKRGLKQPGVLISVVLFLSAACFVFGCLTDSGVSSASENGEPLEPTPADISGVRADLVPAGEYVFNSSGEWSDFWSRYHTTPEPEFDLGTSTLVAVFLGMKPNPGYSVRIAEVTEYRDEVVIEVVEHLPAPGMRYIQVIVYPYDAVLIPKTDKKIRFETSKQTGRP